MSGRQRIADMRVLPKLQSLYEATRERPSLELAEANWEGRPVTRSSRLRHCGMAGGCVSPVVGECGEEWGETIGPIRLTLKSSRDG